MKFVPQFLRSTEDETLVEIRRVIAANGGVVPRPFEFEKLSKITLNRVTKRFGGYGKAISRAGYVYESVKDIYTQKAIEADLRRVLAITSGFRFSHSDYKRNGGLYADKTIKSLMKGSWDDAMNAIGAQKRPHIVRKTSFALRRKELIDLTDDELLDDIGRVWGSERVRPKYFEFMKKCNFSTHVFRQHFGSWSKAIEAYCKREKIAIQGSPGTRTTNEILLAELRSVLLRQPNGPMTYDFYKENGGTYSIKTFQAHFRSWTAAVREVGAVPGRIKYTTDQLFDELQRLWEELGRQPTAYEMGKKGRIYDGAYQRVFGNWRKAIHAFCDDRNKETETSGLDEVSELDVHSPIETRIVLPSQDVSVGVSLNTPTFSSGPLAVVDVKVILKATPRAPSDRLRFIVLMRDEFQCRICGRSKEKDGVVVEVDHIIAYAGDGETTLGNLWTLCRDCNRGKSDLQIPLNLFQNQ